MASSAGCGPRRPSRGRNRAGRRTLREVEERYIDQILKLTGGNKVRAAAILGIDRKTLYRRAERRERERRGDVGPVSS